MNIKIETLVGRKILQITFFVISMLLIVTVYFYLQRRIIKNKEYSQLNVNDGIVYQTEEIFEKDGNIILSGFVFLIGIDSTEKGKRVVLLHDMISGENLYLKTERTVRDDVNKYFQCEYDYSNSGFYAWIDKDDVDMVNGKYQVCMYDTSYGGILHWAIESYLIEGKLYGFNTVKYQPFDFSGTKLESLLYDAEICVCRPDLGICVYQKNDELYWVADQSYQFEENGRTYIQFQMHTTQIENLPQERLDIGWHWSDIGFYFEENELEGNFGEFRVTRKKIPTEYSITDLWTGYCNGNEWIWVQFFYIKYDSLWNKKGL